VVMSRQILCDNGHGLRSLFLFTEPMAIQAFRSRKNLVPLTASFAQALIWLIGWYDRRHTLRSLFVRNIHQLVSRDHETRRWAKSCNSRNAVTVSETSLPFQTDSMAQGGSIRGHHAITFVSSVSPTSFGSQHLGGNATTHGLRSD